jgi:hypothetical protein
MLGAGFGAVFQSDVPQIAYESDPEGNWDIFLPLRLIPFRASTKRRQFASFPTYAFESCTRKSRIFIHSGLVNFTSVIYQL